MFPVIELEVGKKFIAIKDIPKMIADAILPDAFPHRDFDENLYLKHDGGFVFTEGESYLQVDQYNDIQRHHLELEEKYKRKIEQLIRNKKLVPLNQDNYTDKYFYPNVNDHLEKPKKTTKPVDIRGEVSLEEFVKLCNSLQLPTSIDGSGIVVIVRDNSINPHQQELDSKDQYDHQKEIIKQIYEEIEAAKVEAGVNAKIKKGHIDILRNEHFQQMMWGDKITFSMSKQTIFNTLRDDKQELWGRTGQSTFDRWIKTDDAKMLYFFLATRKKENE
jgi:hypothetical protein